MTRLSTLIKLYDIDLKCLCSIISNLGFEVKESPFSTIPNELVPQIENELDARGMLHKKEESESTSSALLQDQGDSILTDDIKRRVATIISGIQDAMIPSQKGKWVLMAKISSALDENMIYYKKYGFDRLKLFLEKNEYLVIHTDDSKSIPRHFVQSKIRLKVKEDTISKKSKEKDVVRQPYSHENFFSEDRIPNIMEWAKISNWPSVIRQLRDFALEENWGDCVNPETGVMAYPVLDSYFSNTFIKCWREKKVLRSTDLTFAAFNTGLVDYKYKDIFAVFSAMTKPGEHRPWLFSGFCVEGEEYLGKILVKKFDKTPRRAEYFKDKFDLLFDTNQEPPKLDSIHIIVENIDRLPYEFIKMNAPKGVELLSPKELAEKTIGMEDWDKKEFLTNYYDSLRDAVLADSRSLRRMFTDIKEAMDIAIKRVEWNYKSAIPMYWPRGDKMCLFLPLCLLEDNKVDTALVVNKTESGRYQGETIYRLDWAYKCARLVCRPDSDWLSLDRIQKKGLNVNEEIPDYSE